MLANYLKTAWRSIARNKLFSATNIAGLAIGMAGCILIGLYISNELSYDNFQNSADRLFRVTTEYSVNGTKSESAADGSVVGPRLTSAFPQIESYVRILNWEPYVVQYKGNTFVENKFCFADSTFFTMFSFPLLEGSARTALDAPNKVVITRSMEKKYFGHQSALGKVLRIADTKDYLVSGVALDPPANSQIRFDFVASYASLPNANELSWWVHVYYTYFLLHNAADAPALEKNIAAYMKEQGDVHVSGDDYLRFHLEPFAKVHLHSPLDGLEPNGSMMYIEILAAIALLILSSACVNYTNLAIAIAARRTREIGIRKVLGSKRWQLFWQFIGESFLLNSLAMLLAIGLAELLLPQFSRLAERSLDLATLIDPRALAPLLVLWCFISFASGAYPAFILSNLKLTKIMKSGYSLSHTSGTLRKSLIAFQFIVSTFLIIATIIVLQQMSFLRNKNLGYSKDHVLVLPVDRVMRSNLQSIKDALRQLPGVVSVSSGAEETTNIRWDDEVTASGSFPPLFVHAAPTDIDFVKTMGLHLIAGSDFAFSDWMQMNSVNAPLPPTFFIANETLVRALGWTPNDAVGKTIYRGTIGGQKGIIRGVVEDFNFASLHEPVSPLLIFLDSRDRHIFHLFVKVSPGNLPATLRSVEGIWKQRVSHRPFQYHFLDDNYNALYRTDRQTAQIFSVFAGLSILLAILGLYTLTAYITSQRTKEIGIRKVLGAREVQIIFLIAGGFLKLVAAGSVAAFPIAWLFANGWLQNFAYRIEISWLVYPATACVISIISLASISVQATRAAWANPVQSLRSE
jgi:putative ABC transport system permease protein